MAKRIAKILCVALAVIMMVSTIATTVFAKEYYYNRCNYGDTVRIETGKRPWYSLLQPKVIITNEGNNSMLINVYNETDDCYTLISFVLKPGRSFSPSKLKCNKDYTIELSMHWNGGGRIAYSISEVRYIDSIG